MLKPHTAANNFNYDGSDYVLENTFCFHQNSLRTTKRTEKNYILKFFPRHTFCSYVTLTQNITTLMAHFIFNFCEIFSSYFFLRVSNHGVIAMVVTELGPTVGANYRNLPRQTKAAAPKKSRQ